MSYPDLPATKNATQVPVALIQDLVAQRYGLQRSDLLAHRRDRATSRARMIAMWMAKNLTALSYPRLGGLFGREHTTVADAVTKVQELRAEPAFAAEVDALVNTAIAMASSGNIPMPRSVDPAASAR